MIERPLGPPPARPQPGPGQGAAHLACAQAKACLLQCGRQLPRRPGPRLFQQLPQRGLDPLPAGPIRRRAGLVRAQPSQSSPGQLGEHPPHRLGAGAQGLGDPRDGPAGVRQQRPLDPVSLGRLQGSVAPHLLEVGALLRGQLQANQARILHHPRLRA